MGFTREMEFRFEGQVANLETGEKHKLVEGKAVVLTLKRGVPNQIFMWVNASHTGMFGSNPDPDDEHVNQFKKAESGFPYVTTHQVTWTIDADPSGSLSTIGSPRYAAVPEAQLHRTASKVDLDFDKSHTRFVAVNVETVCDGFKVYKSGKRQFICKLVPDKSAPDKAPEVAKPKIRKETIEVGSFALGDDSIRKIKAVGKMMDYSRLSAWFNGLPERTRKAIRDGKPPGGEKVVCTGYTDNVGDEHMNFKLGTKRAVAVAETLGALAGVSWRSFVATPSKGEQDVRNEEKNREKQQPKHRRVEVTLYVEE